MTYAEYAMRIDLKDEETITVIFSSAIHRSSSNLIEVRLLCLPHVSCFRNSRRGGRKCQFPWARQHPLIPLRQYPWPCCFLCPHSRRFLDPWRSSGPVCASTAPPCFESRVWDLRTRFPLLYMLEMDLADARRNASAQETSDGDILGDIRIVLYVDPGTVPGPLNPGCLT